MQKLDGSVDAVGRMPGVSSGPVFVDAKGRVHPLPLFMPVYQPRESAFRLAREDPTLTIDGLIVNAYFLYKQRDLRKQLCEETDLHKFVGFDGLISTDSGAFQGFTRQLYLRNRDIVRFQDQIGSDVIAPLDLVTPPGDRRTIAQDKLDATNKRIKEALVIAERGIVAGVQQGGRFMDLRQRSTAAVLEMGVRYLAIGSLVPFFNRNHDLYFSGVVIRDARAAAGPDLPIHIYGAGDPVELPFFVALGATIFDSASYGRYAEVGAFMTPYGALTDLGPLAASEFRCRCAPCAAHGSLGVARDRDLLTRHNLYTIVETVSQLRATVRMGVDALTARLYEILEIHSAWFPDSKLSASWERLHQ